MHFPAEQGREEGEQEGPGDVLPQEQGVAGTEGKEEEGESGEREVGVQAGNNREQKGGRGEVRSGRGQRDQEVPGETV